MRFSIGAVVISFFIFAVCLFVGPFVVQAATDLATDFNCDDRVELDDYTHAARRFVLDDETIPLEELREEWGQTGTSEYENCE